VAEIVWTLEDARCLEDIHDYIASDSRAAAHKVVSGIYEKIQLLHVHPRLGQRYDSMEHRRPTAAQSRRALTERFWGQAMSSGLRMTPMELLEESAPLVPGDDR
jgi:plasmid stabilization system protein ParE